MLRLPLFSSARRLASAHKPLLTTLLLAGIVLAPPAFAAGDKAEGGKGEDAPEGPPGPPGGPKLGGPLAPGPLGGPGGPIPGGPVPGPRRAESGSDDQVEAAPAGGTGSVNAKKVPCVPSSTKVTMDYVDASLMDVTKYMAEITCRNFILSDDLKGQITIISHQQVQVAEAYEAYLSALEVAGYTTVTVGKNTKVVATSKAANAPLRVYEDGDVPATDNFVTQIIQLENVTVADVSSLVKDLAGPSAKIIGYSPTNTLIITDAAYNIRRVYRIVKQLDVAAPKSRLEVIPIRYATAADVEKILEEVYGVAASTSSGSSSSSSGGTDRTSRRRARDAAAAEAPAAASATNVGSDSSYISKIISDVRTNSLIVLANEQALAAIKELVARVDIDIDPASRSQIHVIYLQHAKAVDVASVLGNLSEGRGGSSSSSSASRSSSSSRSSGSRSSSGGSSSTNRNTRAGQPGGAGADGASEPGGAGPDGGPAPGAPAGPGGGPQPPGGGASGGTVVAAFDSGMRVTADENTNSLVIIAAPEDFQVLKGVVDRLDISRRQVYIEAVVVEVGSTDTMDLGLSYHGGKPSESGGLNYASGQFGASSASLPIDTTTGSLLSGLAVGVFGAAIPLTIAGTQVDIPAFGIALNALASNSDVSILSNPNLLAVDNEEATITVGRNVPFPVSSGYSSTGQPVVSYQRQDVGITLQVTPQINEANEVTMDLSLEVAEVEEGSDAGGGFTTSKRKTENVVVVRDNQTIVIGGLIGNTDSKGESKIPILGDIPLIGFLFRGKSDTERKTNLLIFLTPHVINEPADLEEVYRVKMAQREEFLKRFYGKSREEQEVEFRSLMTGSMNFVDTPSVYRTKTSPIESSVTLEASGTAPAQNVIPDSTPAAPVQAEPVEPAERITPSDSSGN